ncbi:MAG: hypothetical protein ACTSSP_01655 [Candidatus Asgardarchaeia archaeon]
MSGLVSFEKSKEAVINTLLQVKAQNIRLLRKLKLLLAVVFISMFVNFYLMFWSIVIFRNLEYILSQMIYLLSLLATMVLIILFLPFAIYPTSLVDGLIGLINGTHTLNLIQEDYFTRLSSNILLVTVLSEILSSHITLIFYLRETFSTGGVFTFIDFLISQMPFIASLIAGAIILFMKKRIFIFFSNRYLNIFNWKEGPIDILKRETYPKESD